MYAIRSYYGRTDDKPETVTKRLEVYENQTKPAVEYYKQRNLYTAINGNGTVDDIFARLCEAIDTVK